MERKKTIAVIRLHSDELREFWQGLVGFHLDPRYLSETQKRDESKRQTKFVWLIVLCEMVLCETKRNEICTLRNENLYFAK